MTNTLDEQIASFEAAMDAFKVVRRMLDQRGNPVANTQFHGKTPQEGHNLLDQAEEQLKKLVAFSLFAAFERLLRDHLSASLGPLRASPSSPAELAAKLHAFLESGVDRWPIADVIDLFVPPADAGDAANAKGLRTFRHHVAHGAAPSAAVLPQTAYRQLSAFLSNAGLKSAATAP